MSELCSRANSDTDATDALHAVQALRTRLEALERQHVASLLGEGATFAAVAQILGISRQSAHQRYRNLHPVTPPAAAGTEMRRVLVTSAARGTVRLARQEATALGAHAVGTEHLLLALTQTAPDPVARVLKHVGIDERTLRLTLQPTIVDATTPGEASGGFTVHAREVLEGSLREAVERGEGFIGADHLLLALLRNPAGGAAQTLDALGVQTRAIFETLINQADPPPAPT